MAVSALSVHAVSAPQYKAFSSEPLETGKEPLYFCPDARYDPEDTDALIIAADLLTDPSTCSFHD
jgi:hypothetical protein